MLTEMSHRQETHGEQVGWQEGNVAVFPEDMGWVWMGKMKFIFRISEHGEEMIEECSIPILWKPEAHMLRSDEKAEEETDWEDESEDGYEVV